MDRCSISRIDIKNNPQEYIDLTYKIELMYFIKGLLYEYYASKGLV